LAYGATPCFSGGVEEPWLLLRFWKCCDTFFYMGRHVWCFGWRCVVGGLFFFFIISIPSLEIHTSHWKFSSYLLIFQILSLFVWFLVVFILFYQISISSLEIHNCVLLFFQIWSSFFWFYFLNCILFSIWFFFSIFSFNSKF